MGNDKPITLTFPLVVLDDMTLIMSKLFNGWTVSVP